MAAIDLEHSREVVEEILSNEIAGEYAWLDFKLEYKNNPEELIHDIVCLSNAQHNGDRYIVYGVENATWNLRGLSNDLISNDIYTIVNNQVWNHKPIIAVDHVYLDGHKFGFIVIADSPTKPHYLRKPYKKIPAGAVYTRQGDTNTPYKAGTEVRSIEDGELEAMFRERFGLDKPLLEKLEVLLKQSEKWEEFTEGDTWGYFHLEFPEYQIRFYDPIIKDEDSWEDWVELHYKQTHLVEKESEYSRVSRSRDIFGWGKRFSIYVHSTPIYQEGAIIRLYKVYCPYPKLLPIDDRYHIRTNISEFRKDRISYFVGAITCLKNRDWIHHASEEELVGTRIFRIYNAVMRSHIDRSRADPGKKSMLVLDTDAI